MYCFRQNWLDPKLTKTQNCTHLPPDLSLEIVLTKKNCIRRKSKSQHTFVFLTKCLQGRIINGTEGARLLKPSKLVKDPNPETWVLGLFLASKMAKPSNQIVIFAGNRKCAHFVNY